MERTPLRHTLGQLTPLIWHRVRGGLFALALLAALGVGACKESGTPGENDYAVLDGTVEGLRADTFELTIRVSEPWPDRAKDDTTSCLLTNDTEIYVNDRFSNFDAIAIGDTVQLIGYREPSRRGERFIGSFVYITRNEPLPSEPDLSPPPTQPTSQP